jgi:hypothetical protein
MHCVCVCVCVCVYKYIRFFEFVTDGWSIFDFLVVATSLMSMVIGGKQGGVVSRRWGGGLGHEI